MRRPGNVIKTEIKHEQCGYEELIGTNNTIYSIFMPFTVQDLEVKTYMHICTYTFMKYTLDIVKHNEEMHLLKKLNYG